MHRASREGGCFLRFYLSGSFGFEIAGAIARRCKLPIGHEISAQILFRNIKRTRRAGVRRSRARLRETFCLLRILECRVWLEQAINQFSLLFLCARRDHLKQQRKNNKANTHALSLQGESRIVKKNARSYRPAARRKLALPGRRRNLAGQIRFVPIVFDAESASRERGGSS